MKHILFIIAVSLFVICSLLFAACLDQNREIQTIYSTLESRCPKPSCFDKDTLSCVITYQVP